MLFALQLESLRLLLTVFQLPAKANHNPVVARPPATRPANGSDA